MVNVWESLSLRIGYAKAVLVGVPEEYITYAYRTSHQVLRWLPTKLAEWIGANLCEELNIPDKGRSVVDR